MEVKLIAKTQRVDVEDNYSDTQAVALTAIRTCYSHLKPSEIVEKEGSKYFERPSKDNPNEMDISRLIRHIVSSGHTSTLEHLSYNFSVSGVSRALLAQLTRHRIGWSYSVQSQRYVKFSSESRSGGFDYVVPEKVELNDDALHAFELYMHEIQSAYDRLIELGVPQEDARAVLPQAGTCNLVVTCNIRAFIDFYSKRKKGNGAQNEITVLAEKMRDAIVAEDSWLAEFL